MHEREPYSGNIKTLKDLDVYGASVLVRGDLDVDRSNGEEGQLRLRSLKGTVDYLVDNGAREVIILGHVKRPDRRDPKLSTKELLTPLKHALGRHVDFRQDFNKPTNQKVSVFENLRFWEGENSNDPEFARQMAQLGDLYVNDAFGTSHRSSTSMVALAEMMPAAAGLHLEEEIDRLEGVLQSPRDGFIAVVGGAKVETKVPVIRALAAKSELVLIGGLLPYELKARHEELPYNTAVARYDENLPDIDGPSTALFSHILRNEAANIIWNGPMGSLDPINLRRGMEFGVATREMAVAIGQSKASNRVVGGGDTVTYLSGQRLLDGFSFVSTGGGAMLEFIGGYALPALEALRK